MIFFICAFLFLLVFNSCSSSVRYRAPRTQYKYGSSKSDGGTVLKGKASYYGHKFHGRQTASGEIFNMYALTAAHKSLPFGTRIHVTNISNKKTVVVIINDRGPFVADRILDLSYQAAKELDMLKEGTTEVLIKIIQLGQ